MLRVAAAATSSHGWPLTLPSLLGSALRTHSKPHELNLVRTFTHRVVALGCRVKASRKTRAKRQPTQCPAFLPLQVEEWARVINEWAATYGARDSVMLVEELRSSDDVRGTGGQH